MSRIFLGRTGAGTGSSVYVEQDSDVRRYYVGKTTYEPCLTAIRSTPPDMAPATTMRFANNGYFTASTTIAWNVAMRDLREVGWLNHVQWHASQKNWRYHLPGGAAAGHQACRYDCGLEMSRSTWRFECPDMLAEFTLSAVEGRFWTTDHVRH